MCLCLALFRKWCSRKRLRVPNGSRASSTWEEMEARALSVDAIEHPCFSQPGKEQANSAQSPNEWPRPVLSCFKMSYRDTVRELGLC